MKSMGMVENVEFNMKNPLWKTNPKKAKEEFEREITEYLSKPWGTTEPSRSPQQILKVILG